MFKTKLVHWSDMVPNLLVYIKNFNIVCLFVPHVLLIVIKENGPNMIPKTVLKSGLSCQCTRVAHDTNLSDSISLYSK